MKDIRLQTLAKNLINYSVELKKGETLCLEVKGKDSLDLAKDVITEALNAGGTPFLIYSDDSLTSRFLNSAGYEQISRLADVHLDAMKKAQCYICILGNDNSFDLSSVEPEKMKIYKTEYWRRVHTEQRVKHTRWCALRYPNISMATAAEMNQEDFEDFYFSVCNLDYRRLAGYADTIKNIMEKTKKVRIKGPGKTDIIFSIEGIPAIPCIGKVNIPDGEVFTAPVKNSVNGIIQFNTPTLYNGISYNNICLELRDGKIIKATCDGNDDELNKILDTDDGARYIGEFALGINPFIMKPMKDVLFDEKIWGSIHFTPGASYDEASNGNKSVVHWDLVLIQRPEFGGGEIYFDDILFRKDGEFVHPELKDFKREKFCVI